ncbi:hypothetical protein TNCV_3399311 [Trichonephila clavipes]|nr:hypothetical protein TNCV_3399311 [Trichonephila clavipes]
MVLFSTMGKNVFESPSPMYPFDHFSPCFCSLIGETFSPHSVKLPFSMQILLWFSAENVMFGIKALYFWFQAFWPCIPESRIQLAMQKDAELPADRRTFPRVSSNQCTGGSISEAILRTCHAGPHHR